MCNWQATSSVKDMVRKDILCRNEGCGAWIEPKVNHKVWCILCVQMCLYSALVFYAFKPAGRTLVRICSIILHVCLFSYA